MFIIRAIENMFLYIVVWLQNTLENCDVSAIFKMLLTLSSSQSRLKTLVVS